MDYSNFLFQVGNYTWLGYMLATFLVVVLNLADKSYYFGSAVLIMSNLAMQVTEPALMRLVNDYNSLIVLVWYPVWALYAMVSVYVIYLLHVRAKLTMGFVASSMMISFAGLCTLQVVRFFDRLVFQTDLLGVVYKIGINSINIGCLFILLFPIAISLKEMLAKRLWG
ncbi:hypothetical protein [Rheinheimera maricola]|uniref:Uncharacterized protein n=1 Tax=Rheinheimera maricola TaxID=2793282 RepID=A0ABS7X847_9GAMM|nr:hypothetical protein [Rheinheimera maricola]MBZ9610787.1 hypothetical protein [Rheinheimera maricola]